jgi:DNA-directed RNA polymerase II subunit RPB1
MSILHESPVLAIQFSLLPPEEILRLSAVEITNRDTYVNNKPVMGGIFDPRMGTLEPGTVCPTDGLNYIQTPGYFGHLVLARPVFYIQYLDSIIEIMKMVCIKCSKLLVDKHKYRAWADLPADKRWKRIYSLAGKVKRCGETNDDGCGCKQPKYKKEGFATLQAIWVKSLTDKVVMKLTPELVLKIFKRISDEDVTFMGFSPVWSRPEWMICQVLAVPPPAVRPSVKHDAQQRSEDDLSHSLIQIIKTNKSLMDKINQNAPIANIDEEHLVLQYYIATMVDNKLSGAQPAAQRSGRAFKSIKDRLTGKMGRIRGNLMGKRVDFSARSVITPDPNLSIQELGVPMKIAQNITKPVKVNSRNIEGLRTVVLRGPDVYPGAKIVEKNGAQISLRYADRAVIAQTLQVGDVVHRHMLDGDVVIFNRQPTLHRMSMMGHIARIMPKGDTFRMNVGDTKPYNADFDGDEMNMHMPQDVESDAEIRHLAAVPHQIISPSTNQSIIGIFQDSLLGAYQFTRPNISFAAREAMALCCNLRDFDPAVFAKPRITSSELISLILPPISLRFKKVEILNGAYLGGQIDKSVLSARSGGIIHRVFNDYSDYAAADFIDNLQYIVNEYMKGCAYSVGISDLYLTPEILSQIKGELHSKHASVNKLLLSLQTGEELKNETGLSNMEALEEKIGGILGEANGNACNIGRKSIDDANRFVTMVNAGSKGSDINIAQMVSCLGQQQVEGKRMPYGFDHRTLPHFSKYDDSAAARGFISASFIGGLSPPDLFFHAMGGRIGLIDTAVKTSTTGYIQRKLVKGLEDLMAMYDGTVRNSKGKIIQFSYGDDNIDPCKIEEQRMPLCANTVEQVYHHYNMVEFQYTDQAAKQALAEVEQCNAVCQKWIKYMVEKRGELMHSVFHHTNEDLIRIPVGFTFIIANVQHQMRLTAETKVDVTPLAAFQLLDKYFEKLAAIRCAPPTELFRLAYYYYLSPKELLGRHFTREALVLLLETVVLHYKKAVVNPGEMVGIIAAQSIGEPTTQLTLNTFHFAGVASKSTVTRGTPRVEEILSLSPNPKNPSITVYLEDDSKEGAYKARSQLEHTRMQDVVRRIEIFFDSGEVKDDDDLVLKYHREFEEMVAECFEEAGTPSPAKPMSPWVYHLELDPEAMFDKDLTMDDINFAIKYNYGDDLGVVYSDYNSDNLVFRLRLSKETAKKKVKKTIDEADNINKLRQFEEELLQMTLRGVEGITKVVVRPIRNNMVLVDGVYRKQEVYVLDTVGTNLLAVLGLPYVDKQRTFSNDIKEMYQVLGIEAARESINRELTEVLEADGYINMHHKTVLCDRMTNTAGMVSMFRSGINNDDIGPIAKASFEETPEMFLKAAKFAEIDPMRGVSANIMCGQEGYFGTNSFDLILDLEKMKDVPAAHRKAPKFKSEAACVDLDVRNDVGNLLKHAEPVPEYTIDI